MLKVLSSETDTGTSALIPRCARRQAGRGGHQAAPGSLNHVPSRRPQVPLGARPMPLPAATRCTVFATGLRLRQAAMQPCCTACHWRRCTPACGACILHPALLLQTWSSRPAPACALPHNPVAQRQSMAASIRTSSRRAYLLRPCVRASGSGLCIALPAAGFRRRHKLVLSLFTNVFNAGSQWERPEYLHGEPASGAPAYLPVAMARATRSRLSILAQASTMQAYALPDGPECAGSERVQVPEQLHAELVPGAPAHLSAAVAGASTTQQCSRR